MNPNHRGDLAEAAIALEAMRLGVEVFRPAADHSRADLVFGIGARLFRVQCKSARRVGEVLSVPLQGCRVTPRGYLRTSYAPGEVDLIAAHSHESGTNYLIEFDALAEGQTTINLRLGPPRNGQRAALHFASEHEFPGAVAQLGERRHGMAEVRGSSPLSSTPSPAEMVTIGAHELRERFGHWMERANAGDDVLVTRHGRPFVRIVPPEPSQPPRRAKASRPSSSSQ